MKKYSFCALLLSPCLLLICSAYGDPAAGTLSASDQKRRCPVESSGLVPIHVTRAAAATARQGDVAAQSALQSAPRPVLSVPLHVHILQDSQGSNPVSMEIINASVTRLNAGFARAGFTFQVESIETVVNDTWANVPRSNQGLLDEISAALNVRVRNAANVYIGLLEGFCGFASLPYSQDPNEAVYLDYTCLPGGRESDAYDTIIHEMGHFMGLLHTFAPEPNGCRGRGDYIADTPFQKIPHFKCKRVDTCPRRPGLDPVRNYMDYTEDSCNHRFTRGQIALMRYAHPYYRIN